MAETSKPDYSFIWSSGGAIVAPSNGKIQTGWTAEVPPYQWENWSQNRQDAAISHILQKGISVWSATGEYYFTTSGERSYVQGSDGNIYVATSDSVNQNPITDISNTYWMLAFREQTSPAHGQCQLIYVSTTSIKLSPFNGNNLVIAGTPRKLPTSGVTLTNAGMAVSTLYYIYAYWTGTTIALEFSATSHVADATTGVEAKSGDSTRTLVGMLYTNPSAQFTDGATSRLVASWFHRKSVGGGVTTSGTITFSSVSSAEISTSVRVLFLNWANEAVDIKATGQYTNNTATQSVAITAFVDGSAYGNICGSYIPSNGVGMSFASTNSVKPDGSYLTEGMHTAQIYGSVTAGTGQTTYLAHSVITRI